MRGLKRILLGAGAAIVLSVLAAPAPAQVGGGGGGEETPRRTTVSPPAERMLVTPSGVDMRSGQYAYSQTDLSIGEDNETGGLALTRTLNADVPGHANPFANFSHNWDVMITVKGIDIDEGSYNQGSGPDLRAQVHFRGRSETFDRRAENTGFDQISRNGYARLTYSGSPSSYVYTLTTGDGTAAVFRPLTSSSECSAALLCAYASSVTYADGTRVDFQYDGGTPKRLRAIVSNRGYALLLQYGSGADANSVTSACVINLAVQARPANNACPASPQAATSYTYTAFESGRRLATAVDANTQISSFTYARVNGALRMGFLRPGDAAAWFTNTLTERANNEGVGEELVDGQAFVDGSAWSFARTYAPQVEGEIPQVAGGQYQDPAGSMTVVEYGFYPRPGTFNPPRVNGNGYPYVNLEDVFFQITPGPIRLTDPLGRVTNWDYCDPGAMANLPAQEHNRCLVMPVPVTFTEPDGRRTDLLWDMVVRVLGRSTRHALTGTNLADIVAHSSFSCSPAAMVNCMKPVTTTDARDNVTDFVWDSVHGGLLSETGPAPTANAPRPQTRHSYAQRYAWISNGAGGWVQAPTPTWVRVATSICRTSGPTGNPAAPCATAGDEVLTQYDYGPDSGPNNLLLRGEAVSATDDGATTTLRTCYSYDARGRRIGETQPNANLSSCPATQTSAQPYTSNQRYDAMGRVTGTISARPNDGANNPFLAVRNSYDPAGRLVRVETGSLPAWQSEAVAPAAWSGFTVYRTLETLYDPMGRKVRDTLREGAAGAVQTVTQYSYDIVGRPECTAVRMNPAAFGSLPASACTHSAYDPARGHDRIARNVYDAAGQRIQLREGVGVPGEEAAEATWAYDANGQITNLIDGNGNRATFGYDGHARQERWTFPHPTRPTGYDDSTQATALATAGGVNAGDYEQYYYDLNSNRVGLRKRDSAFLQYGYDNLNRMTVKIVPERAGLTAAQTRDVHYSYDLRNLQLSARFDSLAGPGIVNAYDGFGRLRTSTTDLAGGTPRVLFYTYDRNGNRIDVAHPDGTWFSTNYDGINRPYYLSVNAAAGIAFATHFPHGAPWIFYRANTITGLDYDGVQRPSRRIHYFSGATVDWTYGRNAAGQVSSILRDNDSFAWTSHYAVNRAYATDGLNMYTAAGSATFTYDGNGNLLSDGARSYAYDIENRLVSASPNVILSYDPLGRLFQVAVNNAVTTTFLYDGDALVAEYDGAGNMTRRYGHWIGDDVPMVSYAGVTLSNPTHLFADHQGSIIGQASGSGLVTAINRYDEYGIPGAGNSGRFQYTGQIWLDEIGVHHYKGRVYSPTLGRFLQTDPVGYQDQFNLYTYVGNDPINLVDPTGRFRDIYIGGASDSRSQIVKSYAERQMSSHPERSVQYFSGGDRVGIASAIATTPHGEPINIIGHSLGGAEGIRQADATDRHIENLITIDPVDLPGQAIDPGLSLGNVGTWTNVTANPADSDWSDRVAAVGGKVDASVTGQADVNVSSPAHHGQFERMMQGAGAEGKISNSYRRRQSGE